MKIEDLPPKYQHQAFRQISRQIAPKTRIASTSSNVEPDTSDEPLGEEEAQGFDTPVCIHVGSVRRRLADADGVSGKAAIDGLTHAGILPDDSPEQVSEVSYSQVKTKGREYTVIEIWST